MGTLAHPSDGAARVWYRVASLMPNLSVVGLNLAYAKATPQQTQFIPKNKGGCCTIFRFYIESVECKWETTKYKKRIFSYLSISFHFFYFYKFTNHIKNVSKNKGECCAILKFCFCVCIGGSNDCPCLRLYAVANVQWQSLRRLAVRRKSCAVR